MGSKRSLTFLHLMGFTLMVVLSACSAGAPAQATPEAVSLYTGHSNSLSRIDPSSVPDVCNCTLRFENISIEQGLSQSSVNVVFQDSMGFLWFGTQDGLNRYDGYSFKVFKPEPDNSNSLSNGWVTAIEEDMDGNLWIGTYFGGLNRYNLQTGKITHYQQDESNPNSLVDNHINDLLIVGEGRYLLIGTTGGLDRLDLSNDSIYHYPASRQSVPPGSNENEQFPAQTQGRSTRAGGNTTRISGLLSGTNITSLLEDSLGKIWIGTFENGLNVITPEITGFTIYNSEENNESAISSNHITSLVDDGDGNIWVGTNNGLNFFNPGTGVFQVFRNNPSNPVTISDNFVISMLMDVSGNLWVGTTNGLNRLDTDLGYFIRYYNDQSFAKSISNNHILSIYQDRGGILWFGTFGGGVDEYDWGRSRFFYFRHNPDNPNSLTGNIIFPIAVDYRGRAWIGTYGNGINVLNYPTGSIRHFVHNPDDQNSIDSDWLLSLMEDHDNNMWIGTYSGLNVYNPNTRTFTHYINDSSERDSISGKAVYAIYEDSMERIWVGTSAGLDRFDSRSKTFIHFMPDENNSESLSGSNVRAILEDDDGYIWVGTAENGLNRLDVGTGKFKQYFNEPKKPGSISSNAVSTIFKDSQGRLWVGTAGGGLNLYHPETGTFTYILEKDGLPNGHVYGILEDTNGRLWISTNYGLSKYDPEAGSFQNFTVDDGLQSNEFNSSAFAAGLHGEFYFGGVNGLTVFDPLAITNNPYPPQLALTSLTQDGQSISIGSNVEAVQQITLEWPKNSLEFEFAALSYSQPNKNQYAYYLDGFDSTWNYIGTKRDGRYTNLPGGDYTLWLKAANNNGVWNENPVQFKIKIIPPFWQTNWFRVLSMLVVIGLVLGGFRLRTRSIQNRNRQLEHLVRERTGALETRNQEIQALYVADERILRNVSLQQVFQTLVDVAVDTLHADRSVVFAWDQTKGKVIPKVSRGFKPESLQALEFNKGEGIIGQVFDIGKPAIIRRVDLSEFRDDIREAIAAEGIRSFVHIPIVVDERIVGIFNVGFTHPNLISDGTTRLFYALTQRAAISIANMELFEQTKDLAVMEERNRLARDLHDSAKQKAFAALAQLGTARGRLNNNGNGNGNGHNGATVHLDEAENLVSDVIQELTFLVQEIYPIALQEKGLPATLKEYVYEWENRNDIKINLTMQNEKRLPLALEQAIYRVAQESLANIARHSKANKVNMSLMYNGSTMQLSVADDGCGFDLELKGQGLGLRSIRERIGSVRGTMQIQSAPGQGTRLFVTVPTEE